MVTTDNENGKLQTYEIAYTFGVYPLQQYMIKFPKGKVQVLDIAWDSRDQNEGGQRWFHLHLMTMSPREMSSIGQDQI